MYEIRKVYETPDNAYESYPLDYDGTLPNGSSFVQYGVYHTNEKGEQEHVYDFETLEESVLYLQSCYEANYPDPVELLEAYHHWIYYRDFSHFCDEVIGVNEGANMNNHLKDKFSWYYDEKGVIKAEVEWMQYNFVRDRRGRWQAFLKYLKENHWKKW